MPEVINKEAIAVYDPVDNPWERSIQDAAKKVTGNWLPSHPCQLLSKAVASLKVGTQWLDRDDLLPIRAYHLFAPHMVDNKEVLVFATHLLYLRDILENGEINDNLHDPVSFVTMPLATFLFRDSPVHIYVNHDVLRSANPSADFLDVGGFLIAQKGKIRLAEGVVIDIHYYGDEKKKEHVESLISGMQINLSKAAATEIAPEVFEIGEHFRELSPEMSVWDKSNRSTAKITVIEPGETGLITVRYADETEASIPKQEFDQNFIVGESWKTAQSVDPLQTILMARGVQGDALLNALDLANDLREKNAMISPEGLVTLYHRTSLSSAQNIVQTSSMFAQEDRIFFGTSPTGAIEGHGEAVVQVKLPLENLELSDLFPSEAYVTMKSGPIGKSIPMEARLWEAPNAL